MKTLHELPRFQDRWSHLYLERGILDLEACNEAVKSVLNALYLGHRADGITGSTNTVKSVTWGTDPDDGVVMARHKSLLTRWRPA